MAERNNYAWTTGNVSELSHRRRLAAGGSGEVHELYNWETNEIFARKLIRPYGEISPEDIENEMRAVTKLCNPDTHINIVSVLNFGKIPRAYFYFLDMEFCEFNLDTYIQRKWNPEIREKVPKFVAIDVLPEAVRIAQIGNIMTDIAGGVAFIHSHKEIHRDLKPQNVLYSCEKNVWKIADFGLTVSGTSSQAYTTYYSRGSSSYRAPELINNGKYNNKVDIWAIGCILVEVLFRHKAFPSDFAVFQYATSREIFQMPLHNTFPEKLNEDILLLIHETLNVNPSNRPAAKDLLTRVQSSFGNEIDFDLDSETLEIMEVSLEVLKKTSQLKSIISRFDGRELVEEFLCLGTGQSGSVYRIQGEDKLEYAVKVYHRRLSSQQIKVLQNLCEEEAAGRNHPHLVPVYTVVEVELNTILRTRTNLQISKLCDGTLNDYLRLKRKHDFNFQMDEIIIILRQILEGLHFMHSKGLLHGNLNPNKEVLYTLNTTSESGAPWFRLSGFEYSLPIGETGYHTVPSIYGAPEVIESRSSYGASEKLDIWAFGCVLMEVVSCGRSKIFGTLDEIWLYAEGTLHKPHLKETDNFKLDAMERHDLNSLLQGCLQPNPGDRPTAKEMLTLLGDGQTRGE